jgi:N-acetylglutamate synthase-like GNAT family acetyltransferase
MKYHLAQVNIARMHGNPGTSVMAGLVARIDEMNRLAAQSKGFVWRLPGAEATFETLRAFEGYFVPFDPERLFYNLSIWESVEDLRHYVFKTAHAEMLRNKSQWIEHFDRAHLALWWVPAGTIPTIAESTERLRSIFERGATAYAFTFKELHPAPTGAGGVTIRPATEKDMLTVRRLAETYALDTERLAAEQFLVAEERGRLVGFSRLKPYPDAVELGCLGIIPERRGSGIARQLVERLLARVAGDVYVTTDVPELAQRFGFVEVDQAPASILDKVKRFEGHRRTGIVIMRLGRS